MTKEQLANEFEMCTRQLKSFILRITASVQDTEDIVHDTFVKATEKLGTFKEESSVKTWLFTIASNLAKDNLRAKKRWTEHVTDIARTAALSNAAFFVKHFSFIKKMLWKNERVALLRYDSRLIPQRLSSLAYKLPVLRMVRPGQWNSREADDIYSELVAYNKY